MSFGGRTRSCARGVIVVRKVKLKWRHSTRELSGKPGAVHFHDLRRSAIRNMTRAGIDRTVAMGISGHTTESTFLRYRIADATRQDDAMERLNELDPESSAEVVSFLCQSERAAGE
ncbi:MAG: tyrosine-type recombinase/integrase [marine benthic group bacterium]|nr:tyrosine-type recombinase/integrase [Gemmatimonadota bacterium]